MVPGLGGPVLVAPGPGEGRPPVADGVEEALLLGLHRGLAGVVVVLGGEQGVEEVLFRAVLLEPADEVADGDVEALPAHDGGVEDEVAGDLADGLGLGGGHALEHLDVDLVLDVPRDAEFVGEGDVVEVVRRDADADVVGVLGAEDPVEEAHVVRVDLGLREVGGLGPVVEFGVDALHREVRALDDAHLDRRPAAGDPVAGEGGEVGEGVEGVGEVRLEDDAGLEAAELLLVEEFGEEAEGEFEVLVLLHVHVDERVGVAAEGLPVEGAQPVLEAFRRPVEVPVVELGHDGGGLHRHVVDAWVAEEVGDVVEPFLRLGLAEDGLAEHVEVEAEAPVAGVVEHPVEGGGLGVEDEVSDDGAEVAPGDGHDDVREEGGRRRRRR